MESKIWASSKAVRIRPIWHAWDSRPKQDGFHGRGKRSEREGGGGKEGGKGKGGERKLRGRKRRRKENGGREIMKIKKCSEYNERNNNKHIKGIEMRMREKGKKPNYID